MSHSEVEPPVSVPGAAPHAHFVWPVVQQHVEETAHLRLVRSVQVRAPHLNLSLLARVDERLAAHVDGMVVSAPAARTLALQTLDPPTTGAVFAAATLALSTADRSLLDHVTAAAVDTPEAARGLASALGWVEPGALRGVVRDLLASTEPVRRALGLQACALHRIDPGPVLAQAAQDASVTLRTVALRTATVLGRADLLPDALRMLDAATESLPAVTDAAALAAAALACRAGEVRAAWPALQSLSARPGALGLQALQFALSTAPSDAALGLARHWGRQAQETGAPLARRRAIQSVALLGDARHLPWLIEQMAEPRWARLAGEAFCWITGADLAADGLETLDLPPSPPDPADDPTDDAIDPDEDDGLAWPDPPRLQRWWEARAASTGSPDAPRFVGQPMRDETALQRVLRIGTQRQRIHAAWLLGLLTPRRSLFPVAAPARRQMAWLTG